MCPICWISGFIAFLLGGSFIATVNHPISWAIGFILIAYSIYKKLKKEIKEQYLDSFKVL